MKKIAKRIKAAFKDYIIPENMPHIVEVDDSGKYSAIHISAYSKGNAGDTYLPVVLRELFRQYIGVSDWTGVRVHKPINRYDISRINKRDMMIIGGGGLFLSDTNPNEVSGWQWNCDLENLNRIDKPIIAFALGYNRFRGQEEFKPIFTDHLNRFVEKALFIGIRNHGSIEKLKPYLKTQELKQKFVFQPCMTTLTAKIYPDFVDYNQKEDFIALNCAFDRQALRSADDAYLKSIARVALALSKITTIKYYSHMPTDKRALKYLDELNVPYQLVELTDVKQIIRDYSSPRLVIGMRGHSQMIPFGCQTPILSIISHDKMQWFLDDINHPEWGADVEDDAFESKLLEKAIYLYNNYKEIHDEVVAQQQNLWNVTLENLKYIKENIPAANK